MIEVIEQSVFPHYFLVQHEKNDFLLHSDKVTQPDLKIIRFYGEIKSQVPLFFNIIIKQAMTDQIEPHILENYQIVKKIGSGAYGHVWKVIDRQTKAVKALKKNFDAFSNSTDAQRTYRQIMFLRQLKHNNIIGLQKTIRAKNDKDIYIVFEHMDVDLHTLIRQDGRSTNLQERHKQYIIYQIAKALYFLHNSNLIHRDIKPSNILINENCEAKLCDFGLVRFMQEPNDLEVVMMTDYIATRWYRAPQLLLGSKDYNKQVDIWALGCLIGQMFYGKPLFPGTSTINQIEKVLAWTGTPNSSELKQLSIQLSNYVLQLLSNKKKLNRTDMFGSKIHPSCLDLIGRMLEFDPSKRLTIEQVLKHQYLSQFYEEKQIKSIRNGKVKIQLHVNDNTKLTVKDYRQILYAQIDNKNKVLTAVNYTSNRFHPQQSNINSSKSKIMKTDENKNYKKELSKDKSKQKTTPVGSHEVSSWNKSQQTICQISAQGKDENKASRKDIKSSLQKSIKSKTETKKKGISLCSKSSSKNTSLSKKKYNELETADSRQLNSRCDPIKKLKPVSRSCSEKYDKAKRIITQQNGNTKNYRKVLLTDCFVNENIGRKVIQMH